MNSVSFGDLPLGTSIQQALSRLGYTTPTPIQAKAIPVVLEGRDVLGCAQTGTGKTAAFALPILQLLSKHPAPPAAQARDHRGGKERRRIQALILAPTRELAVQICDSFADYGKRLPLRTFAIFGGVSQVPQVNALKQGVDILVATPGRLMDLIQQGFVRLDAVEIFVLDEADRMLDMGFMPDLKRIMQRLPERRQNLLFSATIPNEIAQLVKQILKNPVRIEVSPNSSAAERVEQRVAFVTKDKKKTVLAAMLGNLPSSRTLVFTRTKRDANRVSEFLAKHRISSDAIHGNKSQGARQRALDRFRKGNIHVLVATDVASRGIDIDDISHVINMDVPESPESYVHRIGRTGRAGRAGVALTFCSPEEKSRLRGIEGLVRKRLSILSDPMAPAALEAGKTEAPRPAPEQAQRATA